MAPCDKIGYTCSITWTACLTNAFMDARFSPSRAYCLDTTKLGVDFETKGTDNSKEYTNGCATRQKLIRKQKRNTGELLYHLLYATEGPRCPANSTTHYVFSRETTKSRALPHAERSCSSVRTVNGRAPHFRHIKTLNETKEASRGGA